MPMNADKFKYSDYKFYSEENRMSGYIVKVGKKGELYTPKKLRLQMGLDPGTKFIAVVKGDEIILRKRKTMVNLLEEDAIATVSEKEVKKERDKLEKELLER
jgi:AbrB family looped-hinge helix DNA binding protein